VDSRFYGRVGVAVIIGLTTIAAAGCATTSRSTGTVASTSEPARRSQPQVPQPSRVAGQRSPEPSTKAPDGRAPAAHTEETADAAARAAQHAVKMVGKPYRYGGSSPSAGFDCSGLIQYTFRQAGVVLPRSTAEQRRAFIRVSNLREGDLLFFDQEGKRNSHAGIYVGKGHFVHAPSSGKRVRIDRLDSPYWRRHLSEIRRVSA
jgi:murein DD-endopeptidase